MKTHSTIKSTNNSYSVLSNGPSIIQPTKGKRKTLQQNDNSLDLIRSFSKSNRKGNENLASLLLLRDEMIEKITKLEGELIRSNDLISNERHQLSIFGGEHLLNTANSEIDLIQHENKNNIDYTQHIDEANLSKAIQSCIILQPFLSSLNDSFQADYLKENKNGSDCIKDQSNQKESLADFNLNASFRQFFLVLESLDLESLSSFMKASFSQLKWISECNEIYQKIQRYVESDIFIENFQALTKELFFATNDKVTLFILDPKSNEYLAFNEESDIIQISFNSAPSILKTIIDNQTPEIVKSPPNHPSYSEHIDKLFNRVNQSFFAFPIERNALVMVFRLEEPFNNEDFIIGQFYSNLMAPLFEIYVKNRHVLKEIKQKRAIREFESNLSEKVTFNGLLPYVFEFLAEEVEANDANLFIVDEDSFISFEIEDDQISQKKFPRCGIPELIVQAKKPLVAKKLKSDTCDKFDDRIDKWSFNKSFIGFPIFSEKTVIAVLCVSDKNGWNKFNKWDIDILQKVSSVLSFIVPSCILNEKSIQFTSPYQQSKSSFPSIVQSLTFKSMEQNDIFLTISRSIQNLLNCEWLSIYKTIDPKSSEIKTIVTLHNDSSVDTSFLDQSFVKSSFISKKTINVLSSSKMAGQIKTIGDISPGKFLCVFNFENEEKIGAFALNSKSDIQKDEELFEKSSVDSVSALLGFFVLSMKIKDQSDKIESAKQSSMTMMNASNVCESLSKDKEPFQKLIGVLNDLLSMDNFTVLRFNEQKKVYDIVFCSENCLIKKGFVRNADSLASKFNGLNGFLFVNDFSSCEFQSSTVADFFPPFKQLLVCQVDDERHFFVIFSGKSAASNYNQLFQYFTPLLKIFNNIYCLSSEVKYIDSTELNEIDYFRSHFTIDDLISLSFDASGLSDSQKDEAVLKMFDSLHLIEDIGTTVEQLAIFVIKVKHSYKSEVPFHNYANAVNSMQLMFVILMRSQKVDNNKNKPFNFSPIQKAALLIAALLKDVGHEGFDSLFLKKSFSPFVYAHGSESTLEHFHLSTAVQLVQEFLISDSSSKYSPLWSIISSSILATDIELIDHFLTSFDLVASKFDPKNESNLLDLAKLIVILTDFSRFFRPFELSKKQAELLMEEKKRQNEVAAENRIEVEELKKIDNFEIELIDSIVLKLINFLCKIDNEFKFLLEKVKSVRESWSNYTS